MIKVCYFCQSNIKENEKEHYGQHAACFCICFHLRQTDNFKNVAQQGSSSPGALPDRFLKINSSFYHGKFRKYSAELGSYRYILKVRQEEFPELPAAEYLSNLLAKELKLEVASFAFISFNGADTFVTQNFIHRTKTENLIHFYHFLRTEDDFNVKRIIQIIEKETQRASEVERFIDLILFDALIGNHDRHGRNLAMIEDKRGKHLSPFYDNPSYIGIEIPELLGAHLSPKGAIATSKTNEPSMKDYVQELLMRGYQENINDFFKRINIERLLNIVNQGFLSEKRKKAFSKLLIERYEELKNELSL